MSIREIQQKRLIPRWKNVPNMPRFAGAQAGINHNGQSRHRWVSHWVYGSWLMDGQGSLLILVGQGGARCLPPHTNGP